MTMGCQRINRGGRVKAREQELIGQGQQHATQSTPGDPGEWEPTGQSTLLMHRWKHQFSCGCLDRCALAATGLPFLTSGARRAQMRRTDCA